MKVGILGGGQLGRMLALAGYPLGLSFRIYDPSPDSPAGRVAERVGASYEDVRALDAFAEGLDFATYEFENLPLAAVSRVAGRVPVFFPAVKSLETIQDRLIQKNYFRRLEIPTPEFVSVDRMEDLERGVGALGLPAVLKTRHHGYDGKGQMVLREPKNLAEGWRTLGGKPLILETFIPFERELSLIAVRSRTGEACFYPLSENVHHEGILRVSRAPAQRVSSGLREQAEIAAKRIFQDLDYAGVLAIEFFLFRGQLIASEVATRVHNSGHWTLDGTVTSQFENHLRAGLGWRLGSTEPRGYTAMVNLIGELPSLERVLAMPGAHLHLYGKAPRPGRKLGHVNLTSSDPESLERRIEKMKGLPGVVL